MHDRRQPRAQVGRRDAPDLPQRPLARVLDQVVGVAGVEPGPRERALCCPDVLASRRSVERPVERALPEDGRAGAGSQRLPRPRADDAVDRQSLRRLKPPNGGGRAGPVDAVGIAGVESVRPERVLRAPHVAARDLDRGIPFDVVRTWPGGRDVERQKKRQRNAPRLCPVCSPEVTW